jgi:hypothetical protein
MKKKLLTGILFLNTTLFFSQSVLKTMKRLPDTGQNTSYTGTFGEDNDYSINTPFFIDNGNGTVTDTITGLIWQKSDGGEMTIENATTYCSNLILGSETDWRLPNAHELFSIMNLQYSNPSLDASVFTPVLESRFCLATNNKPLGLFLSNIYLVNLTTSSAALNGAYAPPLKRKSLPKGFGVLSNICF